MNKKFLVLPLAVTMLAASSLDAVKNQAIRLEAQRLPAKRRKVLRPQQRRIRLLLKFVSSGLKTGIMAMSIPSLESLRNGRRIPLIRPWMCLDTACRLWYKATIMAVIGRRFRPICPEGYG